MRSRWAMTASSGSSPETISPWKRAGASRRRGPSGGEVHVESTRGTTWVSGEVSARASQGRGGSIRLLGDRVGLAGAEVDASGPSGGGQVLIGGDVSGRGPTPTAEATYVSADSGISADALASGDGGKVVVFADGFANVQGRLSARGGLDSGDGGFVETSGSDRSRSAIRPTPLRRRERVATGSSTPTTSRSWPAAATPTSPPPIRSPAPATAHGSASILLDTALSGGQSVTVQTAAGGTRGGDITLSAPADIDGTTGTNTLTLQAHRHININAPVSDAAGGAELNVVLIAGAEIRFQADVTLRGGSLETRGDETHVTNHAVVTLDGITWRVNDDQFLGIGIDGPGTVVARNGALIDSSGKVILIGTESSQHAGVGTLTIEDGADVRALRVIVGNDAGSQGTVTVTGSGSTLTTAGTDNEVKVGNRGTGTLAVLDGGLVDTLWFDVARSGVGRATIRGVASDGTRSRVIVSPANGRFFDDPNVAGCCADQGGFARVARNAGSRGALEILEGGLLRVRDGGGTWGPGFTLARNKGSVGTLVIDGAGSSLEVIQDAAIPADNPYADGPYVLLGRRGGGTTTIRNGGRLLLQGEDAFVGISRDSVNPNFLDPDDGPITQRSVVNVLSGGRMEIAGEKARLFIGYGGPAADGVVTVSGSGSMITTAGTDNEVRVGDRGTGTLAVLDGGFVDTLKFDVGRSGVGRATIRGVAADGTRSRVIVSPANGRFSDDPDVPGCCADGGGFARVARNAGSRGALEILEGGLLRVRDGDGTWGPGFQVARNKGSVGTLVIDGAGSSLEVIQDAPIPAGNPYAYGPYVPLGRRGGGTTTIRNGGRLLVRGEDAAVLVSRDSVSLNYPESDRGPINQRSVVDILSGGRMEVTGENAVLVIGDGGPAADGVVTVSGSGSRITTTGPANRVFVGAEGTGVLEVLDGGLVDTLWFDVGRSGVGRATIRGVASDGTRSRVIASPANGKFSGDFGDGDFVDQGGFARAGRNAGSRGAIEILEGGLLRVLDGEDTHGPEFQLAHHKGSAGTLLIDGAGSSLELVQNGPAVRGDPNVFPGPTAQLGRRGSGTTTIRNGGKLLVRGARALVRVSRDSVSPNYPDPDTGPINQRSMVNVLSGGRMEITGEGARLTIGQGGPFAEGAVTVSGADSTIAVAGDDHCIVVGDEGIGALTVEGGAGVTAARIVVGRKPGSRGALRVRRGGSLDVVALLVVGKDFDFDRLVAQEPGGTGSATGELGSRVRYGALDVGAGGSTDFTAAADSEVQEGVGENTDAILTVYRQEPPLEVAGERLESAGEQDGTRRRSAGGDETQAGEEDGARDEDGEEGEEDEDSEVEGGEPAGESGEEEREELPMCPA